MTEEKKKPKKKYKKWVVIGIVTVIVIAVLQVTVFREMTLQKWAWTVFIAFACVGGLYYFISRKDKEQSWYDAMDDIAQQYLRKEHDALNTEIDNTVGEYIAPYYFIFFKDIARMIQYEPAPVKLIRSVKRINEDDLKKELMEHRILSEIAKKKYMEEEERKALEKAGYEVEE
jgi:hypothetical protein